MSNDMDLIFDKIYTSTIRSLNICRAHPSIKRDRTWAFQFFIIQGLFTVCFTLIVYNIIYHDLKSKNFDQTCKNGVLFVVYVVITFQYCVLLWHQDTLVKIIGSINRDYELSKTFSEDEKEIIFKYVKQSLVVCNQWFYLPFVGSLIFVIKNVVLMSYYYYINEFHLIPLYDLVYPAVIEDKKDNIYIYIFTYAFMLHFGAYSAVVYSAFVPLGPIFILHACGQLELVMKRVEVLFEDCDEQVVADKLKVIILHLQYIYGFVEDIKTIFKVTYEFTLKATTIILPITCYEVLEALSRGEVSLEFISFIVGGVMISSAPCYYSDLLMEKGEDVRLALYSCGWERTYDRRTRTTLQLMLQHALNPVAIQTLFRLLCLDALTDLFQQSYAIFNLMNAMWK